MKIIDISPENESQYLCCLEEWSEDMKDTGNQKQKWYDQMKEKGLRVKFAVDDNGIIGGMIQYLPIEHSVFEGESLYAVLCIWVHGHKQGRGDYRKKGMGKALLKAAEEDARLLEAKGLVTWGLIIPVFMRASWFKRQGYKVVDKSGIMRLMWKPFSDNATPPRFIRQKKRPEKGIEKMNITMFRSGWCQSMNITCERAKKASLEFRDKIDLHEYETIDKEVVKEWGINDALFIDDKELFLGPPLSYEKIRKKIRKRVSKIRFYK